MHRHYNPFAGGCGGRVAYRALRPKSNATANSVLHWLRATSNVHIVCRERWAGLVVHGSTSAVHRGFCTCGRLGRRYAWHKAGRPCGFCWERLPGCCLLGTCQWVGGVPHFATVAGWRTQVQGMSLQGGQQRPQLLLL